MITHGTFRMAFLQNLDMEGIPYTVKDMSTKEDGYHVLIAMQSNGVRINLYEETLAITVGALRSAIAYTSIREVEYVDGLGLIVLVKGADGTSVATMMLHKEGR